MGLRSAEESDRIFRIARLHGPAGEAGCFGGAIRRAHGRHLREAWDYERRVLDSAADISAENTFIYMRGYPSKEERDKRLKAAHDDPEFGEVVTKQEQNPATKLSVKVHNIDMTPNGAYTAIAIAKSLPRRSLSPPA